MEAFGPSMGFEVGGAEDVASIERLRRSGAWIVFVALGAPRQEVWMARHRADLPGVVLIGVGAAFDVIAGLFREAPAWMTAVGLEWLVRLVQEPRRLGRRYLIEDPWIVWWATTTRLRLRGGSCRSARRTIPGLHSRQELRDPRLIGLRHDIRLQAVRPWLASGGHARRANLGDLALPGGGRMTDYERQTTTETKTVEGQADPYAAPPPAAASTTVRTTDTASVAPGPGGATMATRIVTFVFGILQALLILRIILLLLVANPGNDIVNFVFDITQPFVEPFRGMFSLNRVEAGQSVLDVAAVVALIGWTLIEALILAGIRIFSRRPSDAV